MKKKVTAISVLAVAIVLQTFTASALTLVESCIDATEEVRASATLRVSDEERLIAALKRISEDEGLEYSSGPLTVRNPDSSSTDFKYWRLQKIAVIYRNWIEVWLDDRPGNKTLGVTISTCGDTEPWEPYWEEIKEALTKAAAGVWVP